MNSRTVADAIAQVCAQRGVKRAFGVPGGGSSLDLIAAFHRIGIAYHLCRTETGAALMAAADAEIRNGFGVVVTTQGPGAASAMNGLAHASLDRAPVLFISDGWTRAQSRFDTHQVFDQVAMASPVVKSSSRLESEDVGSELEALVDDMLTAPWGPVHIELTGENARRELADTEVASMGSVASAHAAPPPAAIASIVGLLQASKRPVILVGLEARDEGAPAQILELARRLKCPVLTTYKAKGIVSDGFDALVGHFTGGAAERECVDAADLILLCGLDPIELIGRPWPYAAPVVDIALAKHPVHYVEPAASAYGRLAASIESLLPACHPSDWTAVEIRALRASMQGRLEYKGGGEGMSPQDVVQVALEAAVSPRLAMTVDAGAHMFSAMAFWQAERPGAALISNGLATMGFALPAAIASALNDPDHTTIAFTGDGGLMMCAGELATAAQAGARLCVVVFNDATLSLIALKQQGRGMAHAGVSWPRVDFAAVARGFGVRGFTVTTLAEYRAALREALASGGPSLIDVHVDATGYASQSRALRG